MNNQPLEELEELEELEKPDCLLINNGKPIYFNEPTDFKSFFSKMTNSEILIESIQLPQSPPFDMNKIINENINESINNTMNRYIAKINEITKEIANESLKKTIQYLTMMFKLNVFTYENICIESGIPYEPEKLARIQLFLPKLTEQKIAYYYKKSLFCIRDISNHYRRDNFTLNDYIDYSIKFFNEEFSTLNFDNSDNLIINSIMDRIINPNTGIFKLFVTKNLEMADENVINEFIDFLFDKSVEFTLTEDKSDTYTGEDDVTYTGEDDYRGE